MKISFNSVYKTIVIIFAAIVIVVGLIAAGYVAGKKASDDKASEKAVTQVKLPTDFRMKFSTFGIQNASLLNAALNASMDGLKSAEQAKANVYGQSGDISGYINNIYNDQAKKSFDENWKLYLDQSFAYATAVKNKDEVAKQKALTILNDKYAVEFTDLFVKLNPKIAQSTLKAGLTLQITSTTAMIDSHVSGNYDQEQKDIQDLSGSTSGLFNYIADSIIKQYPDKFKD